MYNNKASDFKLFLSLTIDCPALKKRDTVCC